MVLKLLLLLSQGVTAYQADYGMAAVTVRVQGSPLFQPDQQFNLAMADLGQADGAAPGNAVHGLDRPASLSSTCDGSSLALQSHVPCPLSKPSLHLASDAQSGLWQRPYWQLRGPALSCPARKVHSRSGLPDRGQGQAVGHLPAAGAAKARAKRSSRYLITGTRLPGLPPETNICDWWLLPNCHCHQLCRPPVAMRVPLFAWITCG